MRKRLILLIGCLWLLAIPCLAAGWNNIVPLKTTRAEVIRLLGEPKPFQGTGGEYFEQVDDRIFILWTSPHCFGKKLIIDEKSAGPDALVYQITVEPKDRKGLKYEKEINKFLGLIGQKDCDGPHLGACGISDELLGFGYSRSDIGINHLEYFANLEDEKVWRSRLRPCSPDVLRK